MSSQKMCTKTIGVLASVGAGVCSAATSEQSCALEKVAHVLASDPMQVAQFGEAVDIDGDVAVIGAHYDQGSIGAAYILSRHLGGPDNWGEVVKLLASDGAPGDNFGDSVAISGDTVVVGATGTPDFGAAYIFQRDHGGPDNWGEVVRLVGSDTRFMQRFGFSCSIDGDIAVIGDRYHDTPFNNSGAAYVFQRNHGGEDNWGEVAMLSASDSGTNDNFSYSVAISADTIIIGAIKNLSWRGAAYVFQQNHGGENNWGQVKKITAIDADVSDEFGFSVSIDGDMAMVGAPWTGSLPTYPGSVYFYERDYPFEDNWGHRAQHGVPGGTEHLGWRVAIQGDLAVATAIVPGRLVVFQRDLFGADEWNIASTVFGGTDVTAFGRSLAFDGDTVIVGEHGADDVCTGGCNDLNCFCKCCDSGAVNVYALLGCLPCPGDLVADGEVGSADVAVLLNNWGPCDDCNADLNEDGEVGPADLAIVLGNWGACS